MKRLGLATCSDFPALAPDERPLLPAFAREGIEAAPFVWDDPTEPWRRFDAIVIRSTWDYHQKIGAFLQWIDRVAAAGLPIWNSPDVIRWNHHKGYLRELENRGVPIAPTTWLRRGERAVLSELLRQRRWTDAVVKPAIAANAHQTFRVSTANAATLQPEIDALCDRGDVLIQRYLESIETLGEWSLLFFGRKFSHALIKRAAPREFRVQSTFGGYAELREPSDTLRALADRAIACVGTELLYARVDVLWGETGFVIGELEAIEPFLYLDVEPSAAARYVRAIAAAWK